jgi:hypothetical protein
MSYEGYEVIYCASCGYRLATRDAYDEFDDFEFDEESGHMKSNPKPCPICSSTKRVYDCVDQTNGCFCDELEAGKTCPCHETITDEDIIKYAPKTCEKCDGTGFSLSTDSFKAEKCSCGGKPSCATCFGTVEVLLPFGKTSVVCPVCNGRGKTFTPLYNISKLVRKID